MQLGVWLPSYCYPDLTYERVRGAVDEYSRKCNDLGYDIWVIDHLLHAPGLYGMSWLEPLHVLTHASAVAPDVKLGTGILVLPLRHPHSVDDEQRRPRRGDRRRSADQHAPAIGQRPAAHQHADGGRARLEQLGQGRRRRVLHVDRVDDGARSAGRASGNDEPRSDRGGIGSRLRVRLVGQRRGGGEEQREGPERARRGRCSAVRWEKHGGLVGEVRRPTQRAR